MLLILCSSIGSRKVFISLFHYWQIKFVDFLRLLRWFRYAAFLCRLNDDRNVRALFERALSLLPPEESVEVNIFFYLLRVTQHFYIMRRCPFSCAFFHNYLLIGISALWAPAIAIISFPPFGGVPHSLGSSCCGIFVIVVQHANRYRFVCPSVLWINICCYSSAGMETICSIWADLWGFVKHVKGMKL